MLSHRFRAHQDGNLNGARMHERDAGAETIDACGLTTDTAIAQCGKPLLSYRAMSGPS